MDDLWTFCNLEAGNCCTALARATRGVCLWTDASYYDVRQR